MNVSVDGVILQVKQVYQENPQKPLYLTADAVGGQYDTPVKLAFDASMVKARSLSAIRQGDTLRVTFAGSFGVFFVTDPKSGRRYQSPLFRVSELTALTPVRLEVVDLS